MRLDTRDTPVHRIHHNNQPKKPGFGDATVTATLFQWRTLLNLVKIPVVLVLWQQVYHLLKYPYIPSHTLPGQLELSH